MRRYFSIFIIVVFVFFGTNIVFAEETGAFTLDEVKEMALKNSRALKTMEQVIKEIDANSSIAYNAYNSAYYGGYINSMNSQSALLPLIATKKSELGALTEGSPEWQALKMEIQALEMQAAQNQMSAGSGLSASRQAKKTWEDLEDRLTDTKRAYEDLNKQIEFSVEQLYTSALLLEEQINIAEKNYEYLLDLLGVERLRGQLGMTTSVDIDRLAVQTSDLNKGIRQMRDSLIVVKERINDIIGRDVKSNLELVKFDVDVPLVSIINMEPIIEKTLENMASIPQQERDIEKLRKDLDDIDGSNEKAIQKAKIEQALLALDDTKQNIRNSVNTLVSDMQSKAKAFQLAEITFKNAQKTYEWERIKFELGMISKLQFENSKIAYLDAQNKKTTAGYDYFLAKRLVELAEQGILVM
ncbi:MAG: TolC family protein [Peptococcales bacterium]